MKNKRKKADTDSYEVPKSPIKIPKGDKGFKMVKKSFHVSEDKSSETDSYTPPVSPVKIPEGDTGFNLVKDNYRRFIWTWNEYISKDPKFQKT